MQQNTHSSQVHIEPSLGYMLGHKTSLNKFEQIEILSSIISNHNSMKLEINYTKKTGKFINMWRLNNMAQPIGQWKTSKEN